MDIKTFKQIKKEQSKKAGKLIHMMNFVEWCEANNLATFNEDGSVCWKEHEKGKQIKKHTSDKIKGPRDGRDDLSNDYPGHIEQMGNSKKSLYPLN